MSTDNAVIENTSVTSVLIAGVADDVIVLTLATHLLLISVSVPDIVASVPVVGNVNEDVAVVPNVTLWPELPMLTLPPDVYVFPVLATPVPPCAPVTTALSVSIAAEASGNVNVFSLVVGPENFVNPFPVPPYVLAMIEVISAEPLTLLPHKLLVVVHIAADAAVPVVF